jgi:penicillin-binding protein 2
MRKALAESSDEYFYQVGGGYMDQPGLGIARIDKYAQMFGFATTTGVDLPGEEYGTIPTPDWKEKVFGEDWLLGDTYHTAIGQYGFQLTPIELARGVAALANGGTLVTPHVLLGLSVPSAALAIPPGDLEVIREGMRQGVTQGIGGALAIEGVHVASKSGTAELGVKKDLINSWISGFFPYENPKYVFVVIMEKGSVHNTHGAIFAAREVIEWMRDNTDYTK